VAERHARAECLLVEALTSGRTEAESLRDEAVLLTLDLPEQVARRYRGRGIDHDDLVQVGRMALVKAALGYRPGVGSSFVAYAMPTISGEVKRHFRDCGWSVRPPRRLQEVRALLSAEDERLTQVLRRSPTTDEVADALGLDRVEASLARQCGSAYRALSLDMPDDGGRSLVDEVTDESGDIERMLRLRSVRKVLEVLTEREQLIVRLRFVEDQTQTEIGMPLGVSQMQVSRLLTSILGRLRQGLGDAAVAA
jgi:RNA polymerase sigma-B factor